jgi:RimJ/RimL family protein N-acetyltransferase
VEPKIKASFVKQKKNYQVRPLMVSDVNDEYLSWLNDPITTKYMDLQHGKVTIEGQREYIRDIIESESNAIFGLFDEDNRLVGTSGVQKLYAPDGDGPWIGVLIGHRKYRRHGLGKVLIWVVTSILFSYFDAEKVFAGIYTPNIGSYKAFINAGYREINDFTCKDKKSLSSSVKADTTQVCCSCGELTAPEYLGISYLHFYS